MGLAEQFTHLGEDVVASFDARVNFLGKNIVDTREMVDDTHRLLTKLQKEDKARARKLRADLGGFVNNLRETVNSLRRKNQRERKNARLAWQGMAKALASRRHDFKGASVASKPRATRAH